MQLALMYPSDHDTRVELLEALGTLLGLSWPLPCLPDGTQPDVLLMNPRRRELLIGDAKDTEGPGCTATQVRLNRYMRWAASHARKGYPTHFAIGFGRAEDARGWLRVLRLLGDENGMPFTTVSVSALSPVFWVAALSTRGGARVQASGSRFPRANR